MNANLNSAASREATRSCYLMSHILQHIVQHILDASKLPTFTKSPQVTLCWKMLKIAEGGCLQNLFHCFIVSAFINLMNLMTFWFHPFHPWRFHPHSHGMSRRGPLGEVRSEVLSFSSFELGFSLERILHFLGLHFLGAVQRFSLFPSSKALLYQNSRGFPAMCWSKQHWQTKALPSRPCSQGLEAAVFRQFSFSPVTKVQRIYIECQAHPCQKFI